MGVLFSPAWLQTGRACTQGRFVSVLHPVTQETLWVCMRCYSEIHPLGWRVYEIKAIDEACEQGRPVEISDMWHRNPRTCARVVAGQVVCDCFRLAEMELHDHGGPADHLQNQVAHLPLPPE